jgi:hypothetical protein
VRVWSKTQNTKDFESMPLGQKIIKFKVVDKEDMAVKKISIIKKKLIIFTPLLPSLQLINTTKLVILKDYRMHFYVINLSSKEAKWPTQAYIIKAYVKDP